MTCNISYFPIPIFNFKYPILYFHQHLHANTWLHQRTLPIIPHHSACVSPDFHSAPNDNPPPPVLLLLLLLKTVWKAQTPQCFSSCHPSLCSRMWQICPWHPWILPQTRWKMTHSYRWRNQLHPWWLDLALVGQKANDGQIPVKERMRRGLNCKITGIYQNLWQTVWSYMSQTKNKRLCTLQHGHGLHECTRAQYKINSNPSIQLMRRVEAMVGSTGWWSPPLTSGLHHLGLRLDPTLSLKKHTYSATFTHERLQ